MQIEFGPVKDAVNFDKHGVQLSFGAEIFEDAAHLVLSSDRAIDGEHRFKVIGVVAEKLWTGVYVQRAKAFRFISVRRSNTGEQRNHDRHSG